MKINKKQIVMLALSLVVCIAVYLNWQFLQNPNILNDELQVSADTEDISQQSSEEKSGEETKILGEAQYVSSTAESIDEYFTNSRLTRKQSKDEAIELLKTVVNSESSSAESISKANEEISKIADETELEGTVENLIKAKGFKDCVVFISSDLVNVVVKSDGLTAEQAAQINEIVVTQTGVLASNVKIVEVN